jgi:hypothetical protein
MHYRVQVLLPGDHDHREVRHLLGNGFENFDAGDAGHVDVQQEQGRPVGAQAVHHLAAVAAQDDVLVPPRPEDRVEEGQGRIVVVHHQDGPGHECLHRSSLVYSRPIVPSG